MKTHYFIFFSCIFLLFCNENAKANFWDPPNDLMREMYHSIFGGAYPGIDKNFAGHEDSVGDKESPEDKDSVGEKGSPEDKDSDGDNKSPEDKDSDGDNKSPEDTDEKNDSKYSDDVKNDDLKPPGTDIRTSNADLKLPEISKTDVEA